MAEPLIIKDGNGMTCTLAYTYRPTRINLAQAAPLLHAFVQTEVAHLLGVANSGATCWSGRRP